MNRLRSVLLNVLSWLVVLPVLAQGGDEPILVTDLLKIQQLGSVTVTPGGRNVLYTATTIEETTNDEGESEYEYRTHLYLAPANGDEPPIQLTRGESATEPAWDPSGDRIAFVRIVEGKPQIFVLSMLGGEAWQLTDHPHGARSPRWSPDGTRILFSSTLPDSAVWRLNAAGPPWPTERPGRRPADVAGAEPDPDGSLREVRAWLERNAADGSPRVLTRLDLQGETDLAPSLEYGHFFVIDVDEGAEPRPVTRGFFSYQDAQWLPNGTQIIFSGTQAADQHPDRILDSDLFIADVENGRIHRLLDIDGYAVASPQVSPDGLHLAFTAINLDGLGYTQTELGVLPLSGRTDPQWLTFNFDRSVGNPKWAPNGWHLYFTAASDGGFPLYRVKVFDVPPARPVLFDSVAVDTTALVEETDLDPDSTQVPDSLAVDGAPEEDAEIREPGNRIEQLTGFERGVGSYDVSTATIFFVGTEVANPYELYAASVPFTDVRRLTAHNAEWLRDKRLSYPEQYTLTRDSLEIDYWVMKPAFFREGQRYPLLLQMHGGPSAMWGPGEATMWLEFQYFASRGYGIVYANPRGSGGYGYDYQRANYQDWGEGPASDVLAAASEAAELPWVDPDRQVITGGSYAGYLTAWIVAHDHRFKAAVAQRGVYDLATFLGEGNAWRLIPWHFGGYPWDDAVPEKPEAEQPETVLIEEVAVDSAALAVAAGDSTLALIPPTDTTVVEEAELLSVREILIRNSPITYVDQIETPLLIIHGDDDLRTGVTQSEMLYKSLKILGKPVEYVRYPDAGHELSRSGDPKQRMDRILRIYEFMARFVE